MNKNTYLLVIQQNYGYGHGWEDVSEYEQADRKQCDYDAKEYRLTGYPTRTVMRRVNNRQ